jgi:hypothetical protein
MLLSVLVRSASWKRALEQCEQQQNRWVSKNNFPEAHRLVNSRVVLLLHLQDRVGAERVLTEALASVPAYPESDAARKKTTSENRLFLRNDLKGMLRNCLMQCVATMLLR